MRVSPTGFLLVGRDIELLYLVCQSARGKGQEVASDPLCSAPRILIDEGMTMTPLVGIFSLSPMKRSTLALNSSRVGSGGGCYPFSCDPYL